MRPHFEYSQSIIKRHKADHLNTTCIGGRNTVEHFLRKHQNALIATACMATFVVVALDASDLLAARDDNLRGPVEWLVGLIKGNAARGAVAAGALISLVVSIMKSSPLPILTGLAGILGYSGLNMYIDVAHVALI